MILDKINGHLVPVGVCKSGGAGPAPATRLPHLTVTTDTGSTVYATDGVTTTYATETSTGIFEMDLPEWNKTYTVYCTLDGDTASGTITIDDIDYDMELIHLDPTKMSFTELEFLKVIAANKQSLMTIGATITLSNQYCDTYEVIGVNHDSTSGTVDIMAHTHVTANSSYGTNADYISSSIRTWINGTYLDAFSADIKNTAKTMAVKVNNLSGVLTTINDKVKLLSMTEIGATNTYAPTNEGSLYTGVFTPGTSTTQIANRWRSGTTNWYWLRSRYGNNAYQAWAVYYLGNCVNRDNTDVLGVLPVLRF